ncbi:hypothetical protein DFJ74DRAFT_76412 [Hyaloraphidium curvatum]|nr:hypothetical protein DFJ74DRAFT_76412 [Hyaloraphidium curvatum]
MEAAAAGPLPPGEPAPPDAPPEYPPRNYPHVFPDGPPFGDDTMEPAEFSEWDGGIPVFRPSIDEFDDFGALMRRVEKWGRLRGLVKIVAPKEWLAELDASKYAERLRRIAIRHPIAQNISGQGGVYRQLNMEKSGVWSFADWAREAFSPERLPPLDEISADGGGKKRRTDAGAAPAPTRPSLKSRTAPGSKTSSAAWVRDLLADEAPTPEDAKSEAAADGPEPSEAGDAKRRRRQDLPDAAYANIASRLSPLYPPEVVRELEARYWRTVTYSEPMYGADLSGTLMDDVVFSRGDSWNLNRLGGESNLLLGIDKALPGVNRPYLYFGTWKATFGWHLEDVDLYSINFLHFGAPKQWYCIPPPHRPLFERAARECFREELARCPQFLRHKAVMIAPSFLSSRGFGLGAEDPDGRVGKSEAERRAQEERRRARREAKERGEAGEDSDSSVEYVLERPRKRTAEAAARERAQRGRVLRVVQEQGEFIVTFPHGYHAGFNLGLNCAESVNFATPEWVPFGREAKWCTCVKDSVRIDVLAMLGEKPAEVEEAPPRKKVVVRRKKEKEPKVKKEKAPKPRAGWKGSSGRDARKPIDGRRCELCPAPPSFDEMLPVVDWMPGEPAPPMEKRQWCHRMCALFVPEVTVLDVPDFDWVPPPAGGDSSLDVLLAAALGASDSGVEIGKAEGGEQVDGGDGAAEGGKPAGEDVKPEPAAATAPAPAEQPEAKPEVPAPEPPLIDIVVGVNQIPRDRFRLNCVVCNADVPAAVRKKRRPTHGAPIQCCKGKCTRAVHVSCAKIAGLLLESYWDTFEYTDESGQVITEDIERGRCWCGPHDPRKDEEKRRAQEEADAALAAKLSQGAPVWCRVSRSELVAGLVVSVDAEARTCTVRLRMEDDEPDAAAGDLKTFALKDVQLRTESESDREGSDEDEGEEAGDGDTESGDEDLEEEVEEEEVEEEEEEEMDSGHISDAAVAERAPEGRGIGPLGAA